MSRPPGGRAGRDLRGRPHRTRGRHWHAGCRCRSMSRIQRAVEPRDGAGQRDQERAARPEGADQAGRAGARPAQGAAQRARARVQPARRFGAGVDGRARSRRGGRRQASSACRSPPQGQEPVESAACAAQGEVELSLRTRSVAGVPIVEIAKEPVARARTDRGYSLAATSARLDEVAERFEAVLDRLLDLAVLELSVRRLADEIARTTRRMNALEHIVVPRLEADRARIALVLEEREMEDRVRLRRMRTRGRREGGRR